MAVNGGVWQRIVWLYGLHTILWNLFFAISYYLLPEGFMRASPPVAVGRAVAEAHSWYNAEDCHAPEIEQQRQGELSGSPARYR